MEFKLYKFIGFAIYPLYLKIYNILEIKASSDWTPLNTWYIIDTLNCIIRRII